MFERTILGIVHEKCPLGENKCDIFSPRDEKNGLVPNGDYFYAYESDIRAQKLQNFLPEPKKMVWCLMPGGWLFFYWEGAGESSVSPGGERE